MVKDFDEEQCSYTEFNIENQEVIFEGDSREGLSVSVPFAEDVPQCVKKKLNEIIYQEMNKHVELVKDSSIWLPCTWMPKNLMLNAKMLTQFCNGQKTTPEYYISILITDFGLENGVGTWIDKKVDICDESIEFRHEFISYCSFKVNQLLFPM